MARRFRSTEDDKKLKQYFPDEIEVMNDLIQEALKQAQDRAKAVQEKIKADQERTTNKPRWKRTKEENKHADRIAKAEENLNQKGE